MEIKNLSQLKRELKNHDFRIVKHYIHPLYEGQIRHVNIMQTNGMYTIVVDEPSTKEIWCEFGKASFWKFENGLCKYTPEYKVNGEVVKKPVWEIEVI